MEMHNVTARQVGDKRIINFGLYPCPEFIPFNRENDIQRKIWYYLSKDIQLKRDFNNEFDILIGIEKVDTEEYKSIFGLPLNAITHRIEIVEGYAILKPEAKEESQDLKGIGDAAWEYICKHFLVRNHQTDLCRQAFIAGAVWHKNKQ